MKSRPAHVRLSGVNVRMFQASRGGLEQVTRMEQAFHLRELSGKASLRLLYLRPTKIYLEHTDFEVDPNNNL